MKKSKLPLGLAESILESISDGVFTIDLNWKITYFNRAAEHITKIPRKEAIGRLCAEVFKSSMCESKCPLKITLERDRPIIGQSGYIINALGEKIPISVSTAVLKDSKGQIIGGAETFRDLSELENLRTELQGRYQVGKLISRSKSMQQIFEILPTISQSSSSVLILGETGTGKEVVARTIHTLSPRKDGPFIAINCSALPETLLEAEFFGYKKGSFTGAIKDKPGKFALAHKGTLFLDEIAEMPYGVQAKLLRALQEKEIRRLGPSKVIKIDIRVISATNANLTDKIKDGEFREDLYYRLNTIPLHIPSLKERKDEILQIAEKTLEANCNKYNFEQKNFSLDAQKQLLSYSWPGNIRELISVVERATILSETNEITAEELYLQNRIN